MARARKPKMLQPEQAEAVDPFIHAALSASAGTGKTQVLTARVLRLLLTGVPPETILCLTFTKAAAAEMAERIGHQLAAWVRLGDEDLAAELHAIGAGNEAPTLRRARALFARVLDCSGGLRIQTIHSFCQTLLSTFPAEAGISPGFRPIEGREESALIDRTLATLAEQSDAADGRFVSDLTILAGRMSEDSVRGYLRQCGGSEVLRTFPVEQIETWLRREVDLPDEDVEAYVARQCGDDLFDCDALHALTEANRRWNTATGLSMVAELEAWLALDAEARCRNLESFATKTLLTSSGGRRKVKSLLKHWPEAQEECDTLCEAVEELLALLRTDRLVRVQAAGLRAGAAFARAYAAAKASAGLADFDDLIRWTRNLLQQPGIAEWVRFKLDRQTDHLLVDEAQDTNAAQWAIVRSLVEEYFAGAGSGAEHRTLFIVGDFKQAIYGFQGTDPAEFEEARTSFRDQAEGSDLPFKDLAITASFRSSQVVLDTVDKVLEGLGPEGLGLARPLERHRAFRHDKPGFVELWPLAETQDEDSDAGDATEEAWEDQAKRDHAGNIAVAIRRMIDEAPLLATTGRPLTAADVLVLVRSRANGLASLIVAQLAELGVPTAGLDRLQLAEPLVVKDLLAAMTFAAQPLDDLNLASLLVSPLLGWSQDDLYDLARRDGRTPLWEELGRRQGESALFADTRAKLLDLLNAADFESPHDFLERILSGALQGRRKLFSRLGRSARDPLNELLAAALTFEAQESGGLQRFLHWFASGEVEVKRDPEARNNAVRVMTVHGSKGLEAPVVILADATIDPAKAGNQKSAISVRGEFGSFPVIRPTKAERCEPFTSLIDEETKRELQEHHRLGYVAMTRAAERLIVTGLMPSRGIPEQSWYAQVANALTALGAEPLEGGGFRLASQGPVLVRPERRRIQLPAFAVPTWATTEAPAEARPPRPLAPSQLGPDTESSPPPTPELRQAAERGRLLHALFERLPETPIGDRRAAALAWLERSGGVNDLHARAALIDAALSVIEAPEHAHLFAPGALAEAPIAATLPDGMVVAGTVDRLLVSEDAVQVVDFKTGRTIPADLSRVPVSHRRQMQAYGQALSVIFPGRRIELALLYTEGPRLITLPLETVGDPTHMGVEPNQELLSP